MYRIGEFSKITQLSKKTLRYYDEEGLLSPSYRDQEQTIGIIRILISNKRS